MSITSLSTETAKDCLTKHTDDTSDVCKEHENVQQLSIHQNQNIIQQDQKDNHDKQNKTEDEILQNAEQAQRIKAPDVDAGWAWCIFIGASIIHMFCGLSYVTGLFNVIFLDVFGHSRQLTAWPAAIQSSSLLLFAPLSSLLSRHIGYHKTVFLGGSITVLGYLLTYFAQYFIHVFFTFGFIIGFGNAISLMPAVACIADYFVNYRNVIYGFVSAMMSFGVMIFSPFVQLLVSQYGWRGCMLILSAIHMHIFIAGLLFIPKQKRQESDHVEYSNTQGSLLARSPQHVFMTSLVSLTSVSSIDSNAHDTNDLKLKHGRSISSTQVDSNLSDESLSIHSHKAHFVNHPSKSNDDLRDMSQKMRSFRDIFFDTKLLILGINVFMANGASYATYIHFPEFFHTQGATETELGIVMSVIGAFGLCSRVLNGIMSNQDGISVFALYVSGNGLATIFVLFCPLLGKSFAGQIMFAIGFGLHSPTYSSLLPQMTLEMCPVEDLPVAFGIQLAFCGVSGIIAPPLAGWLYDANGNYTMTFVLLGLCYAVSFTVVMSIPVISGSTTRGKDSKDV